jgi:hypothetical protein
MLDPRFLDFGTSWGCGQLHTPTAFPPLHAGYGRSVGLRAGLDGVEKILSPTGTRSLDRPTRSQSLYRLQYPGSLADAITI